jgi:hypothetical protein
MTVADDPTRHFDDGPTIYAFADPQVLVVCPRCQAMAHVRGEGLGTRRLTCTGCGLTRESGKDTLWGEPVDPWFRLPLWLQAPFRGHVVWAFNERHLAELRAHIAAQHRERGPGTTRSAFARLPTWLTSAKHRDDVLALLDTLTGR